MDLALQPVRKKRSTTPKSPVAGQLSKFLNSPTPKTAIDLMLICATVGENHWDTLLTQDVVQMIAGSPEIEEKFLTALCKQPGQPFAHSVMDAYLRNSSPQRVSEFLSTDSLKRRNHPATLCLYGASFSSVNGQNLTKVFEVLIKHGLCVDTVVTRNISDIERAASLGHRALLKIVAPHLTRFPEEVVRSILLKSMHPIESISILIDECGVSISNFCSPKMLSIAKQDARCYINARLSRMKRIPESELREDEISDDYLFEIDKLHAQEIVESE